jgi:uncharacterized membrane protein YhaH (DUF805 family)
MLSILQSYSGRREYRLASILLLAGGILMPVLLAKLLGWEFLAFAVGLPFYAALVLLTYYRLRNASLSSAWLGLMIVVFHVGPKWEMGSIDLYPTGLISLVPVVMGWLARESGEGGGATAETQST